MGFHGVWIPQEQGDNVPLQPHLLAPPDVKRKNCLPHHEVRLKIEVEIVVVIEPNVVHFQSVQYVLISDESTERALELRQDFISQIPGY